MNTNNIRVLELVFITVIPIVVFMVYLNFEEVATLRRSKFETLRTTKLISKEMEEYSRENNIYEQMSGYKRLRQQHHKELKQVFFCSDFGGS